MSADGNAASKSSVITDDLRPPRRTAPVEVEAPETHQSSLTARERVLAAGERAGDRVLDFFVPPRSLMGRPPGWDELTAYAYRGDWTASPRGFLRGLATIWICTVGLTSVLLARFLEWALTRPARTLAFTIIWLVVRHTGVGVAFSGGIRWVAHLLDVLFLTR